MKKVPYIDYNNLEPYYTLDEACKLLKMSSRELSVATYTYGIEVRCNKFGETILDRNSIRTLHNMLYYENKRTKRGVSSVKKREQR